MILNKTQMKSLKVVADDLRRVYYSQYKRGTTYAQNEVVFSVLDEMTGTSNQRNHTCNTCLLNAYSRVAKAYFETLQTENNKILATPTTETIKVEVKKETKTKSKGGRRGRTAKAKS